MLPYQSIIDYIQANVNTNNNRAITGAIMNYILKVLLDANTQTLTDLVIEPGENSIAHNFGVQPSHISAWQTDGDKIILLPPLNIYTKISDNPTTKFFINNADDAFTVTLKLTR
jgi:hypothetical protein